MYINSLAALNRQLSTCQWVESLLLLFFFNIFISVCFFFVKKNGLYNNCMLFYCLHYSLMHHLE